MTYGGRVAALVTLAWLGAASLAGQSTLLVTRLPAGGAARGMGNAFVVSGRDPAAALYNPALADSARGVAVTWQRWGRPTAAMSAVAAFSDGGVGATVAVRTLQYDGPAVEGPVTLRGLLHQEASESSLFDRGGETTSELAATLAVGGRLLGFRIGVAGTLLEVARESFPGDATATGAAFDVGVARSFKPLTLGVALQSAGPAVAVDRDRPLPSRVTLAAASRRAPLGPLDVAAAARVTAWDGSVSAGGGVEVAYWPIVGRTFVGRFGVRYDDDGTRPTFGASFIADDVEVTYAAEPYAGGTAHLVGLVYRP